MTSVFRSALGDEFERLHPMLQKRFDIDSSSGVVCHGQGIMTEVKRGPAWTLPFLSLGSWRHILFPENGHNVPFTVDSYAYLDGMGRETVTVMRTFALTPTRRRRFDATLVPDPRGGVLDYLGTHQHLAVRLDPWVAQDGSLRLRSGDQHFYEGFVGFKFPLALSGVAELREGYDEAAERYTIDVRVSNAHFGFLFGYSGWFHCTWPRVDHVPDAVKPLREERRI
jgi:hypothetical protein